MSILDDAEYDREKFSLGRLCNHGHDWQGTGKSLRQINNSGCVDCAKGRVRNKEQTRASNQRYYERNKECLLAKNAVYRDANKDQAKALNKRWTEQNRERIKTARKVWRDKNKARLNQDSRDKRAGTDPETRRLADAVRAVRYRKERSERAKRYLQTDHGRAVIKLNGQRRRAKLRDVSASSPTVADIKLLYEKCSHQCVYCGSTKSLSDDHFLPIILGGSHCLGNLIVACKSCNSSKGAKDPYLWFQTRLTFSQKRWKSILKVLGKTQSNYNQIPLL